MLKNYYLFLFFLLIALSSCLPNTINNASGYLSEQETLKYRACQNENDCVYAKNGCCDCNIIGPECKSVTVSCVNNICEYEEPITTE